MSEVFKDVHSGNETEIELSKAVMKASIDRDNNIGAVTFAVAKTKDGVELALQGFLPSDMNQIGKFCEELIVNFSQLAISSIENVGRRTIDNVAEEVPMVRELLEKHGDLPEDVIAKAHNVMAKMTYLRVFQNAGDRIFSNAPDDDDDDDCKAEREDTPPSSKDR